MEHVQVTTADGKLLEADLAVADPAAGPVRGAAVICHPHPLYGGDRHNAVVAALFDALPAAGVHALRFDFRRPHEGGGPERLDVIAALDLLATRFPGVPLVLTGYSFGAVVGLTVSDPRVVATVAVAPPLTVADVGTPAGPTLVLVPAHDQFCPPHRAHEVVDAWPRAEVQVIEMADHSLAGRTEVVAGLATAWISALLRG